MAKPLPALDSTKCLALSLTNAFRKKQISQLQNQQLKETAFKVDTAIKQQQQDLGDLNKTMEELKLESEGLETQFLSTLDKIKNQDLSIKQTRLQVLEIQAGLSAIMRYRQQLDEALRAYNNRQVHRIPVPFQYFYDLHEEQYRMLELLNRKISEIE